MKKKLLITTLAYLLFVVYGSLVPLEFNSIPLEVAWQRFENIRYLNLGIGSRADWVANILLFIPLAFLLVGVLSDNRGHSGKIIASIFVTLFCVFLCVSIEFVQLFFPPRTVSLNDIFAECTGAVIGILAWWMFGARLINWLGKGMSVHSSDNNLNRYLQVYLALLFLYNVMPLDLTISPIEIYHKWNEGRVILFPFGSLKDTFIENLYEWGSEIALWVPVPLLWQGNTPISHFKLLRRIFLAATAIEFFQLFVYSRVTDITDILLALTGAWVGMRGMYLFSASRLNKTQGLLFFLGRKPLLVGGIGFLLWFFMLMLVFWYPYDFKLDYDFIKWRLEGFLNVPFYSYYYGNEFRAITEVFHKTLFFMPLGWVLGFVVRTDNYRPHFWPFPFFALTASALIIEIIQALLPDKNIGSTDIFLEVLGGYIGFIVVQHIFFAGNEKNTSRSKKYLGGNADKGHHESLNDVRVRDSRNSVKRSVPIESDKWFAQRSWIILLLGGVISTGGLLIASQSSFVPYNIRELMAGDYALFRALGLSLSLFWCFGFPVWFLFRTIEDSKKGLPCFFYGVCCHSFFAWLLIRITAPLESIHDIVGSQILAIPVELEIFFRFFALFSIFSIALFGGVLCVIAKLRVYKNMWHYFASGFIVVIMILPICYWIVVFQATTDNLTELLMDDGRSFSVIGLFFYILLIGVTGSISASFFAFRRVQIFLWAIGFLLVSFPLGYALLNWATESVILKYGTVYSAMQFLLSSDRTNFLTGSGLFLSFCMANSVLIAIICVSQIIFWVKIDASRIKKSPRVA